MSEFETLTIKCKDGYQLSARFYPVTETESKKSPILICPATGITKQFYHIFSCWLQAQGYAVMVFDFRGIGESLKGSVKQSKASIVQWGQLDIPAAIDALLAFQPSVIRGNASEIGGLAGAQVESKGVDSTLDSTAVYAQAKSLLAHAECIAISGESDFILSRQLEQVVQVNGGSELQPKVTATGCALGALIAAYAAVSPVTIATVAAHVHFAIAGKLAHAQSSQVGSFNVAFIDAIFSLDADTIREHADLKFLVP